MNEVTISEAKKAEIVRYVSMGFSTETISELVNLSAYRIKRYLQEKGITQTRKGGRTK
jgi:hypothetical protein